MVLKYYIDDKEVDGLDYYDIIFEYIVKDLASHPLDDDEVEDLPPYFTFEELCEDDGIRYEVEGINENLYFEQLSEVKESGKSEVTFYNTVFKIEEGKQNDK